MSSEFKNRKIKFGIVGCGRISQNHFEALQKNLDHAEITAVCDVDPVSLKTAETKTGAKSFKTINELLKTDVDVVSLCTPSGLHAEQTILAAKAGKHVITEKPMAIRFEDGKKMVQACDEAGVKLFVVKQNRLNPTLKLLKRAVDEKRFGRIHMVNVNVFWHRPQSYYDQASWRGTWELDGGAFMNQASHYVDLLEWLIGPIESLHAFTATLGRKIQAEDTGVANFKWRHGALGSMNVTMLTYPKNYEGSITVLGEKGTVELGGVAVNEIKHWEFQEPASYDAEIKKANYDTTSVYGHGHGPYYHNVIQTLRGETKADTDGREGLKSLELLSGIYLSAKENRRITLPL